jgi:hypothetical protein
MRLPPKDFRERFRRMLEEAFFCTRRSMHVFRNDCDYDGFLELAAPLCADERELVLYFLLSFLPDATIYYADAICVGVVQYLGAACGRQEPDGADKQAIKALAEMTVRDEKQIRSWLDSYYPFPLSRP